MTHCSDYDRSRSVSVTILFLVGCGSLGWCGCLRTNVGSSPVGYRLSVIGYRRRNPLTELNVKPVRSLRCSSAARHDCEYSLRTLTLGLRRNGRNSTKS